MADYTYTAGQSIRFGRKDTEPIHLWDFGDGNTSTLYNIVRCPRPLVSGAAAASHYLPQPGFAGCGLKPTAGRGS